LLETDKQEGDQNNNKNVFSLIYIDRVEEEVEKFINHEVQFVREAAFKFIEVYK
jgi:hypothetical protein